MIHTPVHESYEKYDSPLVLCAACILICCEVGSKETVIQPTKAIRDKVWAISDYEKTK